MARLVQWERMLQYQKKRESGSSSNNSNSNNNSKNKKAVETNEASSSIMNKEDKSKKVGEGDTNKEKALMDGEAEGDISLVVPKFSVKWHIDPANPSSAITSSSDRERYSSSYSSSSKTPSSTPSRPPMSRGAVKRTKDFDFKSTNPTIFQALSTMNDALTSASSFMSIVRENSVQVEKTAPWGSAEACNLCYNLLLDFGNGTEVLADTSSLQDELAKLENMSYKELQQLAKSEGVKANQKQDKLLIALKSQLKSMFDEEKEKLKAGPDGNSMSIDTFSNSNALPGTSSSSSQQKVASTMMDVDEMGPIKIQSKTELSWVKLHAQIDAHIKNEGEEVFSKSTINAMFLLKLLLETDHDRYKDVVRSNKLGHIVNVQLKKPLVVAGNDLPAWCNAIIEATPFLLPISVRRQWLGALSQVFRGLSIGCKSIISTYQAQDQQLKKRKEHIILLLLLITKIQQVQAVQFAAQAADRLHEAEMKHHVGALRCDIVKVRHDDDHLLEDGLFLMNLHAQTTNKLEVQFIGENGFGDGVTQGFFLGWQNLQTRSVNKQVQMWAVDTNENEGMLVNKYGLMPKPLPPKSTDDTKMAKMRSQVLERFKFLGRLMGKAHLDGYIVPLPLTTEFFSLVKGEVLPASSIKLIEGKDGFMSGLLNVVKAMKNLSNEEDGPGFAPEMYFDMTGNELCNIFGEDFFTKRHTVSGRKEYTSIKQWLSQMDLCFVDPTMAGSVKVSISQNNSKVSMLRKEMFAAQKKGNMTLVRTLMKKIQQQAKLETKEKLINIRNENAKKMAVGRQGNRKTRSKRNWDNMKDNDNNYNILEEVIVVIVVVVVVV